MYTKKMLAFTAALSITTAGFFGSNNASAQEYKIQQGDSLYKISKQFNTTIDSLKKINHLTSDLIYAGETLEISLKAYVIKPGDSLSKIAAEHGASVEQLKRWNGLNSDMIYAGDTLSVSGPLKEVPVTQVQQKTAQVQQNQVQQKTTQVQQDQVQQKTTQVQQDQVQQKTTQVQQDQVQQKTTQVQQDQVQQKTTQVQQTTSTNTTNTDTTTTQQTQSAPNDGVRTLTVVATAYSANCTKCSGITANGTDLHANPNAKVISVDPSVIPLGSKVWVDGYGEAIAADTGGAIKGNRIDVFIADENEANQWGRRTVSIKILN